MLVPTCFWDQDNSSVIEMPKFVFWLINFYSCLHVEFYVFRRHIHPKSDESITDIAISHINNVS